MSAPGRALPEAPGRRGWCPSLARPMPTGDGLLARVHPPLGILTPAQARAVAEGARRFGNGHIDLTGRANLQVRGVREATRAPLAQMLGAVGLGDVRADGGPQRLTLTGPLSGHDPAETIDVPRLARAIEAAGRRLAGLPAKTLVFVEGRPGAAAPDADVSVRALGPGRVAVAVAAEGGSLDLAICDADDAPAAVALLLAAFASTGRRRARDLSACERAGLAKACHAAASPPPSAGEGGPCVSRGWERGSATGQDVVPGATPPKSALPSPPLLLKVPSPVGGGGTAFGPIPSAGITPLAPGRAILAVDAPFGRCTADALDRLAAVADDLGASEIRLSPARGFVLVVTGEDRARTHLATVAAEFITEPDDPRRTVAGCTGAPACASGTTPTLVDAGRLAEAFRPLAARGLTAHVSGCAKGCAHPGLSDLTLVARGGFYGIVIGGAPADPAAMHLPIEAVLERLGRASVAGLAAAFAPDGVAAARGRDRKPA